jgi:hypothetical protein
VLLQSDVAPECSNVGFGSILLKKSSVAWVDVR